MVVVTVFGPVRVSVVPETAAAQPAAAMAAVPPTGQHAHRAPVGTVTVAVLGEAEVSAMEPHTVVAPHVMGALICSALLTINTPASTTSARTVPVA